MKAMKLCPNGNYNKTFGIAGTDATHALSAYSALYIRFDRFIVNFSVIVLNNDIYDFVIKISFLIKQKCKIGLDTNNLNFVAKKTLFSTLGII